MERSTIRPPAWRCAAALLTLCLAAGTAFAQVPDATIQQIVDLKVQFAENRDLSNSNQIDGHAAALRSRAINADLDAIYRPIRRLARDVQRDIDSRVKGLLNARLATLGPQWQKRKEQFKQEKEAHNRDLGDALTADVRVALESQRRRLLLQQRRERGEITASAFAAEDQKALDEITALRNKYRRESEDWANRFDNKLQLMTQAIATNPTMPIPVSRVLPGDTGTSSADYQHDVKLAADLTAERSAINRRFHHTKDIDPATWREIDTILDTDLARLRKKWEAAGQGTQFTRDMQRGGVVAAAPAPQSMLDGTSSTAPPDQEEIARALRGVPPEENGSIAPFVLTGLGILGVVMYWRRKPKKTEEKPKSTVHGSAAYDPLQTDVADVNCLAGGIFFGKSSAPHLKNAPLEAPGAPICSTPEHHTLIVARTRTGKGTRVIIPTLLRYAGSALVIDPKGENAAVTARTRKEQLGQNIHILNPWSELAATYQSRGFGAATFNPLDILDRNDPNVVATAQTLAGAICPAPANAKDRFWQGSAANVLTAVFLWLADRPEEKKTLARAREIVSLTRKDFTQKFLIPMAASEAFSGAIREMAAPFIDLADETYSGIMSNLSEGTKFLSDPQVKAATAASSFAMEDLATGKTTVYVVIPTERMDTQKTWLRLVIIAAMHVFKHRRMEMRLGHRCLFLIDEFAALGRLDDLPRDIATMSGFGVDFALVVQGLDQLKDHYGEARGTILSNCAYKWFCNLNDLDSAKYLSETLGKATVTTTSTSSSSSSSGHGGSQSQSTSHGETGRSLLNPDEILNLGREVAIVIQPKGHPQYLRPVDYWNLGAAFGALREKHPGLYWSPPLAYDENPYVAGSAGAGQREGQQQKTDRPQARVEKMTEGRARGILGVAGNAGAAEILAAYKRLMLKVHPDQGGSNYLAQEINAAKAFLLGE